MKETHRIEGAEIPEIFNAVEEATQNFPTILESVKNLAFRKIEELIGSKDLVVFLKGNKEKPKSRRSLKMVRILNGYDFTDVDIDADKETAEWVKVYSESSSFPLYYIKGKFAGSLEKLIEETKSGVLFNTLGQDLNERLKRITQSSKYIIVMMGSREEPICGYSKRLIELLNEFKIDFNSFDISIDNEVCEGLKKMFDWPTYPQVYVEGELIGGLDVCTQMHQDGSLREALKL
jgi:Grx4 family monothiol glutaredoxin